MINAVRDHYTQRRYGNGSLRETAVRVHTSGLDYAHVANATKRMVHLNTVTNRKNTGVSARANARGNTVGNTVVDTVLRLFTFVATGGETFGDNKEDFCSEYEALRQSANLDFYARERETDNKVNSEAAIDPHSIWAWVEHAFLNDSDPDPINPIRINANTARSSVESAETLLSFNEQQQEQQQQQDFMSYYYAHRLPFFKTHGFDMLLERGPNGESLLCYALLHGSKKRRLAKFILGIDEYAFSPLDKKFPRLHEIINLTFQGSLYHGEHAGHIVAVVYNDAASLYNSTTNELIPETKEQSAVYWIKQLVQVGGADLTLPRARGSFFAKNEVYLGETVLSFAACMGNKKLVEYLVEEYHVDPSARDSHGNNVLHVLCFWGLYDDALSETLGFDGDDGDDTPAVIKKGSIFEYLCDRRTHFSFEVSGGKQVRPSADELESMRVKVDDLATNYDNETPLLVAIRRGRHRMVEAYLDYKATRVWDFGPIESVRYSINELDTFVNSNEMNHKVGGLTLAVRNNHIKIINLPLFRSLLDAKWELYGKWFFYFDFAIHIFGMILFTLMIAIIPNDSSYYNPSTPPPSRWPIIPSVISDAATARFNAYRIAIELLFLLYNFYSLYEQINKSRYLGENYLRGFGGAENGTQIARIALFIVAVATRAAANWRAENVVWGLYALLSWFATFFYTRGMQQIGPLIIVLMDVMVGDVVQFVRIAALFVIAFGQVFWIQLGPWGDAQYGVLYSGENGTAPEFGTLFSASAGGTEWQKLGGGVWWTLRNFLIAGSSSYDDFRNSNQEFLGIASFYIFSFCVILLINIFIAMVGATFSRVTDQSTDQWLLLRAHLIMQYDESILSKYYKKLDAARLLDNKYVKDSKEQLDVAGFQARFKNTLGLEDPISRIGIPRPIGRHEAISYAQMNKKYSYVHGMGCSYDIFMEVEIRKGGKEKIIKRVNATIDKNSVLNRTKKLKQLSTVQTEKLKRNRRE
ncbi:Transient receptor putative cation channel sub V member 5 [Physocladia obscura]|uniref:Transient receptor putative cation channel sub V member 5 n=1 Tax=Physocladia obscura TaxID=109957 RepID=A0AAD5XHN4_9FUNG|nr:Transient receptor putative cation channel sub V member 5 [Physocladia obscura]